MTDGTRRQRSWQLLGEPPPGSLVAPRLVLHRAVQVVAAFAATHLAPRPDDAHTRLDWLAGPAVLATGSPVGAAGTRVALDPAGLALVVLGEPGEARLHLAGRTFDEACEWLQGELARRLGEGGGRPLQRPTLELPPGPGGGAQPFARRPAAAFGELARWYADADLLLGKLAASHPGASPVGCWPHHFDIAFVIPVARGAGEEAGSVGVGMTPGDGTYASPYWYVTPWPDAGGTALPPLPAGGHWHREGWLGAVLPGESQVEPATAGAQAERAERFLRAAISACLSRSVAGGGAG